MSFVLTQHAMQRMAQRGIKASYLELAMSIASEVEGGFFVRDVDARQAAVRLRETASAIESLAGKRLVTDGEVVVTAYHATRATERRLLKEKTQKRRAKGSAK